MLKDRIVIYTTIFLVAFLFRLIAVLNYHEPLEGDELAYNGLAISILEEGKFEYNASYSRPPGYPFFISIIYFIFGKNPLAVRIAQAILDSFLCILIYVLCKKLFGNIVGLIASFSSAFYTVFIKGTPKFLTETLFIFFLLCVILFIYKAREEFNYKNLTILGSGVAIVAFIKGIMLLFLPFLVLILILTRYYSFLSLEELVKKIGVLLIAFLIPVSIWTYRNYRVYNAFVPISTQGGYALYDCYFPKDGKIFGVNVMDDNVRYAVSTGSQVEMSRYLTKKTLEFIRQQPLKVMKLEFLKILYFWAPFDWEMMGVGKGVYNYQYVFMLPFSFLGMFLLLRKFNSHAPLYSPIVYFLLMSLIFYGSPRFRMVIEPYLIIFFALGIVRFFERFKKKYLPAAIVTSYFVINFIMYLNSDLIKAILRNGAEVIGIW
jgi:4-amino-4-deoxy-L-arabinose transferase-like glycosyltransferase